MAREFRIFEVDKYGNRFFVARHPSLESAKYYLKRVVGSPEGQDETYVIEDELGKEYE